MEVNFGLNSKSINNVKHAEQNATPHIPFWCFIIEMRSHEKEEMRCQGEGVVCFGCSQNQPRLVIMQEPVRPQLFLLKFLHRAPQ